jgi:hypothetical protein
MTSSINHLRRQNIQKNSTNSDAGSEPLPAAEAGAAARAYGLLLGRVPSRGCSALMRLSFDPSRQRSGI